MRSVRRGGRIFQYRSDYRAACLCALFEKKINLDELTKEEKVKYEIAEELGLLDRVLTQGWKSLSSKETGRIGGLMNKRRQEKDRQ